jgi:hypothetical protein
MVTTSSSVQARRHTPQSREQDSKIKAGVLDDHAIECPRSAGLIAFGLGPLLSTLQLVDFSL